MHLFMCLALVALPLQIGSPKEGQTNADSYTVFAVVSVIGLYAIVEREF